MEKPWVLEDENLNPEINEILKEYLLSLKLENKRKEKIYQNKRLLIKFFTEINSSIDEISSDDLLDYITVNFKNLKETTINGYLSILSGFFKFCKEEGYIDKNLVKSRWYPRCPMPAPKYLNKQALAKVRLELEKSSLKDKTIFEFIVSSGVRRVEIYRLNIEDIDFKNKTAIVNGKGNKIRTVKFSEQSLILLERYIDERPKDVKPLFLNNNNERLSKHSIYKIISNIGKRANLNRNIYPHALRHTMATMCLSKGVAIEEIRDLLGHNNLDTTRIYANLPENEIIKLYKKYMGG